ncbi:cation transporter [bacterium]|nr:cation transporter [bacterium]
MSERPQLLRRAITLNTLLVGWNVIEGVVAVAFGLLANSVALLGFGFDSGIEVSSAVVLLWRLLLELRGRAETDERAEQIERRAGRIAGTVLLILAAYIVIDAGRRLFGFGAEAEESVPGIILTALSMLVMPILGAAKLRTAKQLESSALRADAYETIACAWMSAATLLGLLLNATLGWTRADPVAALLIVPLVIREGREALAGDECHEHIDECQ